MHLWFKIIYVSIIDVYKHHDKVIKAIIKLNEQGLFVELNLVGPYYEPSFKKILNIINKLPYKLQLNIKYHGKLNKNEQIKIYENKFWICACINCNHGFYAGLQWKRIAKRKS